MKKIIVSLLMALMLVSATACGKKDGAVAGSSGEATVGSSEEAAATTLGGKLSQLFLTEIQAGKNIDDVANTLSEASEMDCMVIAANEGYLNGFTEEIKGFKSGVQFSPMIGSIPFVGYIFEVDDAESFKENLLSVADPRWNICTEAAETVCVTYENYVFFTMCPGDEE